MIGRKIPLLFCIIGAGLWSLVVVDRCIGEDGVAAAAKEIPVFSEDPGCAVSAVAASVDTATAIKAAVPLRQRCIDVNRAGEKELDVLPGVGPAIARRIIDFRNSNGRFAKLADLDAVKGIGPAMLRKLEGRVCF